MKYLSEASQVDHEGTGTIFIGGNFRPMKIQGSCLAMV